MPGPELSNADRLLLARALAEATRRVADKAPLHHVIATMQEALDALGLAALHVDENTVAAARRAREAHDAR
jgi:hypothetical protein